MKTLVVPTDFSSVSVNAINYAVDMAQAINAGLMLLHVYNVPVSFTEAPVAPVTTISLEEVKRSSEERLEELKKNLVILTSGKIQIYSESRLGDPIEELEQICKSLDPMAVIMGSHGTTGFERMIMGSTTLTAIKHIKCPVIVIPPGTTYHGIKKIGLACDFKNVVQSTPVEYIKNIVKEFGADLYVLNVQDKEDAETDWEETPTMDTVYLDSMLEEVRPNYVQLTGKNVVDSITSFAEKNNLDLVMMIPKKHRFIDSLFHKSQSRELITHAHIPIVSIHE
ncbi:MULTISPECIES: universal stress protein [Niastella]|uniref:Universal stress protein n=1 Tax=Niastella soli TaxID=2821487 RepID=A0ABS3YQF7_9BACT|nr:universal stress protein [Niastella soli]MBO9199812.1 universal stress protein [Niastella soli]